MAWQIYYPDGSLKTLTDAATGLAGTVPTANGGLAHDYSASTGIPKLTAGAVSLLDLDLDGTLAANSDTKIPSQKAVKTYNATQLALAALLAGGNVFTGAQDLGGATMKAPVITGALTATEGFWAWDSTEKCLKFYDGTRDLKMTRGFQPFATHISYNQTLTMGVGVSLAAAGGTYLIPIFLNAHMLLQEVHVVNSDTTLARTWGWDLYVDLGNLANSIARVASSSANETFTAAAASSRTISAASAPVYLPPGAYYLAVQNRHASNTFGLGGSASVSTLGNITCKTKTTTNPNGATLDIIAATWTGNSQSPGAVIRGRAAADTVAW